MIKFLILSIFSVLTVACGQNNAKTDKYDVFLLIGQSNMAGRGPMIAQDTLPIDGVWLLDSLGYAEPAVSPLNKHSSIRKSLEIQQISIANGFGEEIRKHTKNKVLLIVNAKGSSSVEMWAKGNNKTHFYDDAIRRCKEASKYGEIKAILWHQGESNSKKALNYMNKLKKLASDFRKDLGNENIPFIAGEIGQWHQYASVFNPIINTISENIPLSDCVSSKGAERRSTLQDPHFSRDGELLLGKRYAEKVKKMIYNE